VRAGALALAEAMAEDQQAEDGMGMDAEPEAEQDAAPDEGRGEADEGMDVDPDAQQPPEAGMEDNEEGAPEEALQEGAEGDDGGLGDPQGDAAEAGEDDGTRGPDAAEDDGMQNMDEAEETGDLPAHDGDGEGEDAEHDAEGAAPAEGEDVDQDAEGAAPAEEDAAMAAEEEASMNQEHEQDAPEDSRPRIADRPITFRTCDTTLNVMQVSGSDLLIPLSDCGFQHLLAACRANVGVKAGRYMFEVKVVENRTVVAEEPRGSKGKDGKGKAATPTPSLVVGFAAQGSSLFLNEGAAGAGFDLEGNVVSSGSRAGSAKSRKPVLAREVVAVLLNLDQSSPNFNTISLFRNGERVSKPTKLPEQMQGRPLFPTLNFKGVSVQVNFRPEPLTPLPFRCLSLQEAAEEDVELLQADEENMEKEVIFPVGLPDEGTFDWLDTYLKEHPGFCEISDRAVLDWARVSGVQRTRRDRQRTSNDRPGMDFGIRDFDDLRCRRLIESLSATLCRSFVVMEVKNNLIAERRRKALEDFDGFKKTALVVMGEPPQEYKEHAQVLMLEERRQQAARQKKNKEDTGASTEVTLTEEEKALWFRKPTVPDLVPKELSKAFPIFSIPTSDEGFDEVRYIWKGEAESAEYLKTWIAERKLTERVEDLQPGRWFSEKHGERQRIFQDWRRKQSDHKKAAQRRSTNGSRTAPGRANASRSRSRRRPPPANEVGMDATDAAEGADNGDVKTEPGTADAAEPSVSAAEEAGMEKEEDSTKAGLDELDVYAVEDVCDIGNGEPLFANFAYEDWELLRLRMDLHLLVYAYKHDLDDPERTSFHYDHLCYYYEKYYRRGLVPKHFSAASVTDLLELIKDTIGILPRKGLLECYLAEDTPVENFVKLTEDERRERERLVIFGDESARLQFQRSAGSDQRARSSGGTGGGGGGGGGYGSRGSSGHNRGNYGRGGSRNLPPPPPPTRGYGGGGNHGSSSGPRGGYDDRHGSNRQAAPAARSYGSSGASYGSSGGSYGTGGGGGAPSSRSGGPPSRTAPVGGYGGSRGQAVGSGPVGGQARHQQPTGAASGRRGGDNRSAPYGGQESRRSYHGGGAGQSYGASSRGGPQRGTFDGRPSARSGGAGPPPGRSSHR